MSKLIIKGKARVNGEVSVRGTKNAALPIIIGFATSPGSVTSDNVPTELKDISIAIEAMRYLGCKVEVGDGTVKISQARISNTHLLPELACKFRSSLL